MEFMVRVQSELKPKGCHPERSRRTSLTWVTSSAFVRSALCPVAIPFARDDIAMLWVLRPVDWYKLPDNHRLLRRIAMAPYGSTMQAEQAAHYEWLRHIP